MRIIRVKYQGRAFYAGLDGERVHSLQNNVGMDDPLTLDQVSIQPLVSPTKIIAVGLNYTDHAEELGMVLTSEPSFFLKPPSSLLDNNGTILVPHGVGRVDYEAELAIVIGQFCKNVSVSQAPDYIFGYTCANDITARDLQSNSKMFGRCKGYDTFCPLGPWVETDLPPENSAVRTLVNGQVRQEGYLKDMIFKPLELVSFISTIMKLTPGDVILTGTPKGVGPIGPGDKVQVEVENVGLLTNTVALDTSEITGTVPTGQRLQ